MEALKFGNAARLSQRTRSTTKGHKGEGTARGPVERGGLRTPRFGEGRRRRHEGLARCVSGNVGGATMSPGERRTENGAPLRATDGVPEQSKARNGGRRARSAAKPQSDRWSPRRSRLPLRLCGPLFPGHCRPFFQNRLENGFFVKESGWEEEDGANMVECMHEKG